MTFFLKLNNHDWSTEHPPDVLEICFLAVTEEITTALNLDEETLVPFENEQVGRLAMVPPSPLPKQVQTTFSENSADDSAFSAVDPVHVLLDENVVSLLGVMNRSEPLPKMSAPRMLIPHDAEVVFVEDVCVLAKPFKVESASFPRAIEVTWIGEFDVSSRHPLLCVMGACHPLSHTQQKNTVAFTHVN